MLGATDDGPASDRDAMLEPVQKSYQEINLT